MTTQTRGPASRLLEDHILRHLEIIVPAQAIVIPLKMTARYFYEGEVRDQRCLGPSRWMLGIRSPVGEADLIAKTLQLVKVCSSQFVPELVKRALPGLEARSQAGSARGSLCEGG